MSSLFLGRKGRMMGLLNNYILDCQRAKLNLRVKKGGRPRFALGLKNPAMGSKIKNGATRLKNILFHQWMSFRRLFISSLDTFKSNFFLPSFSRREDSIDKASKFSCKCTSRSFFRLILSCSWHIKMKVYQIP